MRFLKLPIVLLLLALALFATYKLAAAAHLTQTENYQMNDEQWRRVTQAREAEISAEVAQQKAYQNYQQTLADVRTENKWPADIVFDHQAMHWQKQAPAAAPKPAEQPVKK